MARTRMPSHRSLLLASAAGFATFAAFGNTVARATDITISTQLSGLTTLETLVQGDNLTVTNSGGLTITAAATGVPPAVGVAAAGAGTIANGGTIVSDETPGVGIAVMDGASLDSLINNVGGVVEATGSSGAAIGNNGTIVGLSNSGVIQASSQAAVIANYGYIGSLTNNAGGVIQSSGQGGSAILSAYAYAGSLTNNVGGVIEATGGSGNAILNHLATLAAVANGGLIQATGTSGRAIFNDGIIDTIANAATGVIQATGDSGIAIENYGATIGGIANSGLVQATGADGWAIHNHGTIGTITNAAGGVIQATGSQAVAIYNDNAGTIAAIANSGAIRVSEPDANYSYYGAVNNYGWIGSITNHAGGIIESSANGGSAIQTYDYLGSITNNAGGVIQATGQDGSAINTYGWVGSITNNAGGVIQATGDGGEAIDNNGTTDSNGTIGTITNAAGAVIQATAQNGVAIDNDNGGTIAAIDNFGAIRTSMPDANYSYYGAVNNYGWIGSITNHAGGVIESSANGGAAIQTYDYLGSIANNAGGVIQATGQDGSAIQNYYGWVGSITNNAGGVIQATGPGGDAIDNNGTIGTITNAAGAVIQATGSTGVAIDNGNRSAIATIANSGTIQATGAGGIAILNHGTLGAIVNDGVIRATATNGIAIQDAGAITNGITNLPGGLIQGGPANGSGVAIDASQTLLPLAPLIRKASVPLSITTGGTIIGAIKQSPFGDTLTVTGGAIIGDVIGDPGSHGVANFALGAGSFTTGGNITGVDTVNLTSGMLVMAPGGGTISGAQAFNILPGGHAVLGSTLGAALTTNSGILDVGTNAPTLNGNYVQTADGSLEIGVNGSAVGELKITGSATITPGPKSVLLHFTGPANLSATNTLLEVQGGLTLTSGTTLPVVSDSPNPYYQSPIVTDPVNVLTLTFAPPTQPALLAYATSLFPASTSPYLTSAAAAYGARITTLNESTYNNLTNLLSTLAPSQLVAIEQQAAPRSIATAAAQLADGLGANTGLDIAMTTRQMASHGAESDPPGHGIVAWAQPFGSTAYQASVQNFDGFSAGTYGAAFGGDTRVTPDIRVGAAFALANSNINYTGGSDGNTDTMTSAQFGVYGTYYRHNFFLDADLSGGYNWFTSKQTMAFLGQQTGSYGGSQFAARAGIGYNLPLPGAVLTPGASIRELHMGFDSYTMSGGLGPSAHVNAESLDLVQSRVGAQITYLPAPQQGWVLRPEMHAYYLHNFNSSGVTTAGSFSNGLPFAVYAPSRDADLVDVGLGLTMSRHGPFSFGASIQYTAGHSTSNDTFLLHLETAF